MVKKILYLVVLLSGLSILLRKEPGEEKEKDQTEQKIPPVFWLIFGSVTGLICALSGGRGTDPCHAASCCVESSGQNSGRHCAV